MIHLYNKFNDKYIPKKAHEGDAGYDIFLPHDICMMPGSEIEVDTGVIVDPSWSNLGERKYGLYTRLVLRSSSGIDLNLRLKCTEGIIDAPYNGENDTIKLHLQYLKDLPEMRKVPVEDYSYTPPYFDHYVPHIPHVKECVEHGGYYWYSDSEYPQLPLTLEEGTRIAQIIICPYVADDNIVGLPFENYIKKPDRGGIGSTGDK